jgi:hypothetical protein
MKLASIIIILAALCNPAAATWQDDAKNEGTAATDARMNVVVAVASRFTAPTSHDSASMCRVGLSCCSSLPR